jgi:hypothetical protein
MTPLHAVLALSMAAAPALAPAGQPDVIAEARATAGVSRDDTELHLRNQVYDFVTIPLGDVLHTLLVHRQQETVQGVGLEGFRKEQLSVEVWNLGGPTKQLRFRLQETASDSALDQRHSLLIATQYGCCDATNTHAVHSLHSGQRLFFTGGWRHAPHVLGASWPDQRRHMLVGVHVSGSARDEEIYRDVPPDMRERRARRLLVTVTDGRQATDRLVILLGKIDQNYVSAVVWALERPDGYGNRELLIGPPDGKPPPTSPRIRITLSSGKIELPVEGMRVVLKNAVLPPTARIARLKAR